MEQAKKLVLHVLFRCDSLSITTPVSPLANEFDVRSVKATRASELGSCQSNLCNSGDYERLRKSKDSIKDFFENVIF